MCAKVCACVIRCVCMCAKVSVHVCCADEATPLQCGGGGPCGVCGQDGEGEQAWGQGHTQHVERSGPAVGISTSP